MKGKGKRREGERSKEQQRITKRGNERKEEGRGEGKRNREKVERNKE